jgi:ABC-type protease/lipase transport system fused ATPase/permease subunit
LFAGSISENIARLNEPDEGLVIKAAEMAGCHEMIMQLADGYNTKVGVNGNNLSMGQQQRIGLARAFYGNPTYIFLDEPNSNLDSEGDASLMHAIQAASKNGSTILLVAHRTSVLSNCNKILVLKSGQQLAFGPKEEVLKKIAQENKLQP